MPGRCLSLLGAVLLGACTPSDQTRDVVTQEMPAPAVRSTRARAPTLINRDQVSKYRDDAARLLLPAGDSLTVQVFARIDEQGMPHQPEIKQDLQDERIRGAAISVVQMMRFNPAQADGRPVSVLLTIPVRFLHQAEK